jgi:hypothetical protein
MLFQSACFAGQSKKPVKSGKKTHCNEMNDELFGMEVNR